MSLENIITFLTSTKHQKTDLVFTILLPLISGVLIILIVKPAWVISSNIFTLCLLSVTAVFPVWVINVFIWALIGQKMFNKTLKHIVSWLSIPEESRSLLKSGINEITMPSSFFGSDITRKLSSITTAICSYLTAIVCYLTKPSLALTYLCLIFFSIILSVLFIFVINKIVIPRQKPSDLKKIWEEVKYTLRSHGELKKHAKERIDKIERIIKAKKEKELDNTKD